MEANDYSSKIARENQRTNHSAKAKGNLCFNTEKRKIKIETSEKKNRNI